ncbi:MAG: peptidoglycan DD-metalloendopeptidase family protein [Gammaproteobacteria bacterium]|nr:peptidoglycan DD-metalloendopeptidase family protein [Gammaproteobacteria bacterium]
MPVRLDARLIAILVAVSQFAGCGTTAKAPVESARTGSDRMPLARANNAGVGARQHVVARGDTLHSIAWRYRLDYREIARWNRIKAPFIIYPGQRLALHQTQGSGTAPRPAPRRQVRASAPHAISPPTRRQPPPAGSIQWQWPARGKPLPADTASSRQGLDLLGQPGQPIWAAAAGEVVYSGDGLVGYGRLIIIRHDDVYLSAYAHNRRLLVQEGHRVARGQQIAEMGNSGSRQVKLYFEIRRNGRPVPPLRYLPKARI